MPKQQKPDENLPETTQENNYAIMQMGEGEISTILAENLGGEKLTAVDLESVKVPAGGSTTWTMETIDGEVETKTIDGIIIFTQLTRAYWPSEYSGGSEPPQCTSQDSLNGIGDPGGDCLVCPLNEFGSAKQGAGRGKACSEKRHIFLVTADETLPIIIKAPAMSLKGIKKYLFGLTSKRQAVHSVYTRLTLEKDTNADGIVYSKIVFTKIGDVENPELSKSYADGIKPHLIQVTRTTEFNHEDMS